MNITDRIIMFFYLIGTTCLFGLLLVFPFGYIPYENVKGIIDGMFDTKYYIVVGILLILLNLKLLAGLFAKDRASSIGVVKLTADGEINITNDTLKSLVLKTANNVRGVRDVRVIIRPGKEKLNIVLKVLILPDVNIPETVKELQASVKSYIETIAEIPVGDVRVIVQDLTSATKLSAK